MGLFEVFNAGLDRAREGIGSLRRIVSGESAPEEGTMVNAAKVIVKGGAAAAGSVERPPSGAPSRQEVLMASIRRDKEAKEVMAKVQKALKENIDTSPNANPRFAEEDFRKLTADQLQTLIASFSPEQLNQAERKILLSRLEILRKNVSAEVFAKQFEELEKKLKAAEQALKQLAQKGQKEQKQQKEKKEKEEQEQNPEVAEKTAGYIENLSKRGDPVGWVAGLFQSFLRNNSPTGDVSEAMWNWMQATYYRTVGFFGARERIDGLVMHSKRGLSKLKFDKNFTMAMLRAERKADPREIQLASDIDLATLHADMVEAAMERVQEQRVPDPRDVVRIYDRLPVLISRNITVGVNRALEEDPDGTDPIVLTKEVLMDPGSTEEQQEKEEVKERREDIEKRLQGTGIELEAVRTGQSAWNAVKGDSGKWTLNLQNTTENSAELRALVETLRSCANAGVNTVTIATPLQIDLNSSQGHRVQVPSDSVRVNDIGNLVFKGQSIRTSSRVSRIRFQPGDSIELNQVQWLLEGSVGTLNCHHALSLAAFQAFNERPTGTLPITYAYNGTTWSRVP